RETGGELGVSLSVVDLTTQDSLDKFTLVPGPHVKLAVSDTGCGMSKELLERIFEPYFTTKKHGEGTGMGLSVVHGIVKSNHGHITVYSEPGRGTEFHFYLPQIATHGNDLVEKAVVPIPQGSGTILVVDDEVAVGQLLRELLLSLGYEVVLCSSSTQALETFQQNGARIDLVLTDMTMPTMNGAELIRRIKHLNPAMPVVLCTGFSDIMDEDKAKRMGIDGYLLKPVIKSQLAQIIHEIMRGK
ncbi:MAG: response regulator, partial [Desulfocapsaceae bacterium]|nr:response regulator [Desulfocapsaceae bacterium]